MRKLILSNHQCVGDAAVMTAVPRDLHLAYPGQFLTDVRTSCPAVWEHNPHLTSLSENDPHVEVIDMHYPRVHQSNQRPGHFIEAFVDYLASRLKLSIPVTRFGGEVFLTEEERAWPLPGVELPDPFWIIIAGGKYDFTAKWWDPARYQQVVDHYRGIIHFVQCGEAGHWHPRLQGCVDLVGRTTLRQFIRLIHHAAAIVCPVTGIMHLSPAIETRRGRPKIRPCVVLAGGREPAHYAESRIMPNRSEVSLEKPRIDAGNAA